MRATNMKKAILKTRLLAPMVAVALLLTATAFAAAPGIKGTRFALTAQAAYVSQPDGQMIYSWGYGCAQSPGASAFLPQTTTAPFCNTMQVPGPTLIVTEGDSVSVALTNNLPLGAGNTSILFPGFTVNATGGVQGLLTQEAAPNTTVTYTFTPTTAGTRAYYSGTQSDLQVEMGMYGAIIVLPKTIPSACTTGFAEKNRTAESHWGESDFRLAAAAYNHPKACYDREYLFQFSEIDPRIHSQAQAQVAAADCTPTATTPPALPSTCTLNVATEPYVPAYFMINGRSMPDDMDGNYAQQYQHQPYNGNPHMHPGEQILFRVIGQGRWLHPFHEHGNRVRVLARDGKLILSAHTPGNNLAGPLLFTTTTTPGQAMDGIFYWTGKGLDWDVYGHNQTSPEINGKLPCIADSNGCNTVDPTAINYYEWCQDHKKPLDSKPFGDV